MRITVGIPVYNEEKSIGKTLHSLFCQYLPENVSLQIIVVASGCTDGTEQAVHRIMETHKEVSLVIERERKGKPSAWNLIRKKARTKWIVFTDGDVILGRHAVKNLLLASRQHPEADIVGGIPLPLRKGKGFISFISSFPYRHPRERKISGYLYMIRRDALKSIPLETINEDDYLSTNLNRWIALDARVYVSFPENLRDYINQKTRIYAGKIQEKTAVPPSLKHVLTNISPLELFYLPGYVLLTWYCRKRAERMKNKQLVKLWKPVTSSKI